MKENNIIEELRGRLKDLLFSSVQYLNCWIDSGSNPYEVAQEKKAFEESFVAFQNIVSACPKEYDLVDWPEGGLRSCARKTFQKIRLSIDGLDQAPNMVWGDTEIGGRERHCKSEIQAVRFAIKDGLVLFGILKNTPTLGAPGFGVKPKMSRSGQAGSDVVATGVSPFCFG